MDGIWQKVDSSEDRLAASERLIWPWNRQNRANERQIVAFCSVGARGTARRVPGCSLDNRKAKRRENCEVEGDQSPVKIEKLFRSAPDEGASKLHGARVRNL